MSDNQTAAQQRKMEAEGKAAEAEAKAAEVERRKTLASAEDERQKSEADAKAKAKAQEAPNPELARLEAELNQLKVENEALKAEEPVALPTGKLRRGTEGTITSDATGRAHDQTGKVLRKSDPGLVRIVEARDEARKAAKS